MTEANPFVQLTEAGLNQVMRRSLKIIAIIAVAVAIVLTFTVGWQTAVLLLVGAFVSATGLYEWQQLIGLINAKLDNARSPRSSGWVVTMFFLRLLAAALVLYVSLRSLHGSVYALLGGLGLAVTALSIEVLRLMRN